jgi:hypothetical protein
MTNTIISFDIGSEGGGIGTAGCGGLLLAKLLLQINNTKHANTIFPILIFIVRKSKKKNALTKFI